MSEEATADRGLEDWRKLSYGGLADCCSQRGTVMVAYINPYPEPPSRHVLFCGHHYRINEMSLLESGFKIVESEDEWSRG